MSVMIVTGGGRGIGAAIARKAGDEGWDVAVNYSRSKDRAERVAAEIRSQGRKAIAVQTDVSARAGGMAKDVPYACSKGALDAFTLGLAKEVGGEGIRAVSVRPGITRTEIFDDYEGGLERAETMARRATAIGRIAEPEEVAGLAVWLCSPDASYITATT